MSQKEEIIIREASLCFSFIEVALLPRISGITFDPSKVYLKFDDGTELPANKYLFLAYVEKDESIVKQIKEGRVICGSRYSNNERLINKEIDGSKIALDYLDMWNCIDISFDIVPPDPKKMFSIKIKGVEKDGKAYELPDYKFKEADYMDFGTAP